MLDTIRADGFSQRQQPILHREARECRRHSPRLETDILPATCHQCSGGAQENKVTKVSKARAVKYTVQENAIRRVLMSRRLQRLEDTWASTWTAEQLDEGTPESFGVPWRAAHGVPSGPHNRNTNKHCRESDGPSARSDENEDKESTADVDKMEGR